VTFGHTHTLTQPAPIRVRTSARAVSSNEIQKSLPQSPEDKIIRRRVQRLQWQPHHDFGLFCGRRLKRNGVGGTRTAFNFSNLRQIAGKSREAKGSKLKVAELLLIPKSRRGYHRIE
jgi:hypothetical protein